MRLIDADALIEEVWHSGLGSRQDCVNLIQEMPTLERPHGTCKTCKHYVPYRNQFSYGYRGDGYCKSTITNSEGNAYINCHDEWYCANYEREGEAE